MALTLQRPPLNCFQHSIVTVFNPAPRGPSSDFCQKCKLEKWTKMTPKFSQNFSKNARKAAMRRGLPCCGAGLHGPMNTPPIISASQRRGDASASHISRTSRGIQNLLPFQPPSAAGLRRKILEFPANSGTRSAQRRRNPRAKGLVDFSDKKIRAVRVHNADKIFSSNQLRLLGSVSILECQQAQSIPGAQLHVVKLTSSFI